MAQIVLTDRNPKFVVDEARSQRSAESGVMGHLKQFLQEDQYLSKDTRTQYDPRSD
jgi:hypothetical protein